MTNVVFQGTNYPAGAAFWLDATASGVAPVLCQTRTGAGNADVRPLDPDTFLAVFTADRVGGWVWSPHKSVTVLVESLPAGERSKAADLLQAAALFGLKVTAEHFQARTGAQGRDRIPADPAFAVFAHPQAFDRSPQWHFHIYLAPRVTLRTDPAKSYAANGRQLYEMRELFNAAAGAKLAEGLANAYGVAVEPRGPRREPAVKGVPEPLCREVSPRRQRIEEHVREKNLPDTPRSRQWAAWATRNRAERDAVVARAAFDDALRRNGFSAAVVMNQRPPLDRAREQDVRTQLRAFAAVRTEADRLAAERGSFNRVDLTAWALTALTGRRSAEAALEAVDKVLGSPNLFRLTCLTPPDRNPCYTTAAARPAWEKVFSAVRADRAERASTQGPAPSAPSAPRPPRERKPSLAAAVLDRLRGPGGVAIAFCRTGEDVVRAVVKAYAERRQPIIRVRGPGDDRAARSLAGLVRDLSRRPRREAHRVAVRAALRPNFRTPAATVAYAEAVYRAARRPKARLAAGTLVVVERFGRANPADVEALLALARGRAKVFLADGPTSNAEVRKAALKASPDRPIVLSTGPRPDPGQQR